MSLTKTEFKIWLLQNGYTQKTLGEKLGLSEATLSTYNKVERYPIMFQLSLKALEQDNSI